MNFHQLLSKMQELDQPVPEAQTNEATIEECGDMPPAPMGMEHKDTPPPSMSVNLNAQGLDDIAELMKLMTKVNPDMINQPDSMPDHGVDKLLPPPAGPSMADLRDKMIEPEPIDADGEEDGPLDHDDDEEIGGALAGGAIGALAGGPMGALTGAAAGDSLTDPDADEVGKETFANSLDGDEGTDYKDTDYMVNKLAGGMNKPKTMVKHSYKQGDNPMAMPESKEELRASIRAELLQRLAEAKGAK
jgi:hypothetical protein